MSRAAGLRVQHGVVTFLGFSRRHVADGLQEPAVVEPVDPFQRGVLDGLKASPGPAPVDHFDLVEAIDGLGQGVLS